MDFDKKKIGQTLIKIAEFLHENFKDNYRNTALKLTIKIGFIICYFFKITYVCLLLRKLIRNHNSR